MRQRTVRRESNCARRSCERPVRVLLSTLSSLGGYEGRREGAPVAYLVVGVLPWSSRGCTRRLSLRKGVTMVVAR
eukprot:1175972-Prorocentrum_minimum.AAC.1